MRRNSRSGGHGTRSELQLKPQNGWQTIRLSAGDFRSENGGTLKDWRGIDMLELDSKGGPGDEPIFGDFRWVPAE